MFYKNYSFEVNYSTSNVKIHRLDVDKYIYEEGEHVMVDMEFENLVSDVQDVVVKACIMEEGTDEVVDGLVLCTLKNLTGNASYSSEWNSSGILPGYYYIHMELLDTKGFLLDKMMYLG